MAKEKVEIARSSVKISGTVLKPFNTHKKGDEVSFSARTFRELAAKGLVKADPGQGAAGEAPAKNAKAKAAEAKAKAKAKAKAEAEAEEADENGESVEAGDAAEAGEK